MTDSGRRLGQVVYDSHAADLSSSPNQTPTSFVAKNSAQQNRGNQGIMTAQSPAHLQQQQRSVKRPRPVKSCTECRKRKLRCDRALPCVQCQKAGRDCKYTADQDASGFSDGSDVESAEIFRPPKRIYQPGGPGTTGTSNGDAAYPSLKSGDSPRLSGLEELTQRMDRLERRMLAGSPAGVGAASGSSPETWSKANAAVREPINGLRADTIRGLAVKRGGTCTRLFGQHSSRVILNVFEDAKAFMATQQQDSGTPDVFASFGALHKILQDNLRTAMKPISVFADSMMPVQKRMTDILPKKEVCDRLVQTYFDTSESIYRILHAPAFYEAYDLYWEGKLQCEHFLPQLLSVLSVASRFETKTKGMGNERTEGVHIPTACSLVRTWLDSLEGKQLVDISTIQVEILLLHARRMITWRLNDSWTKLGYVVRLAMNMGMHRDPSEFGTRIPVYWGEMRRRLWFTLVDMDLHMSIACNMPPILRDGDFTCKPPRNLNDVDIFMGVQELPLSRPIDQVTDNQMQVYAAMTMGVRVRVAPLVSCIDSIRDLNEVLELGTKLERFLDDINHIFPRSGGFSPAQKSKQWRSRVVLDMHVRRPLLALYRPLALGGCDVPAEISRVFLKSSVVILKYLDELDPMVAHFHEIAEMYHQILKPDIVQACLSVCSYVQLAVRQRSEVLLVGQPAMRMPLETSEEFSWTIGESMMPWSPLRLINAVQDCLELLIKHTSGSDTKDIVCLAVVLEMSRTAEPTPQDVTRSLYAVLDACLRATNVSREKLHAALDGARTQSYEAKQGQGAVDPSYGYGSMGDLAGWLLWGGWE